MEIVKVEDFGADFGMLDALTKRQEALAALADEPEDSMHDPSYKR